MELKIKLKVIFEKIRSSGYSFIWDILALYLDCTFRDNQFFKSKRNYIYIYIYLNHKKK